MKNSIITIVNVWKKMRKKVTFLWWFQCLKLHYQMCRLRWSDGNKSITQFLLSLSLGIANRGIFFRSEAWAATKSAGTESVLRSLLGTTNRGICFWSEAWAAPKSVGTESVLRSPMMWLTHVFGIKTPTIFRPSAVFKRTTCNFCVMVDRACLLIWFSMRCQTAKIDPAIR